MEHPRAEFPLFASGFRSIHDPSNRLWFETSFVLATKPPALDDTSRYSPAELNETPCGVEQQCRDAFYPAGRAEETPRKAAQFPQLDGR
jgi:hypothetical protein